MRPPGTPLVGDWAGDKFTRERHHLDVLTMLAQLGALPTPPNT